MSGSISQLTEATFAEEINAATEAGGRRLLGRVVRAVQDDRPHPGGDRRRAAGASSGSPRSTSTSNPGLARQFNVMSIPTMIVFKDGEEVQRIVGAKGKAQLLEDFSAVL